MYTCDNWLDNTQYIDSPNYHVLLTTSERLKQQTRAYGKFKDTKMIIRNRSLKDWHYTGQLEGGRQTMVHKTLHRKLKDWVTWTSPETGGVFQCSDNGWLCLPPIFFHALNFHDDI